jgi:hypothetical protein
VAPAQVNEQLINFLLLLSKNVTEVEDVNCEALSKMMVGGTQSLLQGGDPMEENFRLVVDQIPVEVPYQMKCSIMILSNKVLVAHITMILITVTVVDGTVSLLILAYIFMTLNRQGLWACKTASFL